MRGNTSGEILKNLSLENKKKIQNEDTVRCSYCSWEGSRSELVKGYKGKACPMCMETDTIETVHNSSNVLNLTPLSLRNGKEKYGSFKNVQNKTGYYKGVTWKLEIEDPDDYTRPSSETWFLIIDGKEAKSGGGKPPDERRVQAWIEDNVL